MRQTFAPNEKKSGQMIIFCAFGAGQREPWIYLGDRSQICRKHAVSRPRLGRPNSFSGRSLGKNFVAQTNVCSHLATMRPAFPALISGKLLGTNGHKPCYIDSKPGSYFCLLSLSDYWIWYCFFCFWIQYQSILESMFHTPGPDLCYKSAMILWPYLHHFYLSPVKRICVFEHSVMTNFNCACPAIQRDHGSGFLSEGSSWLIACMSEQRRFWRDCVDAQARLNLRCSYSR